MVTGSPAGHMALWNLEEKKLQSQIRDAHASAVTGLQCLPSEPLMVTSSPDNSIKVHHPVVIPHGPLCDIDKMAAFNLQIIINFLYNTVDNNLHRLLPIC